MEALQDAVEKARNSEEWRLEYMTLMMEYRERYNAGILDGREEGRAVGKAEAVLELLEDYGEPSKELRNYIMAQTDLDTLKQWNKLAAKSDSIEAFEAAIAASPSDCKRIDAPAK